MHYLDNYINNQNLTEDNLRYIHLFPVKFFAYNQNGNKNYKSIKGNLAILHRYKNAYNTKDIFYILDKTGLSRWQKLWLKFSYMF